MHIWLVSLYPRLRVVNILSDFISPETSSVYFDGQRDLFSLSNDKWTIIQKTAMCSLLPSNTCT